MSYRTHEVAALIVAKPREARARVLTAFVQANANRTIAASLLGCRRSTLAEWIRKLGMASDLREVEKIAKRDGWYHGRNGGAGWHQARRTTGVSDPF